MCYRFLQVAWSFLRTGDLPHHDASQVEGIDEPADAAPVPMGERAMNAAIIFGLLFALMMTGMPISICARPHRADIRLHHDRTCRSSRWR